MGSGSGCSSHAGPGPDGAEGGGRGCWPHRPAGAFVATDYTLDWLYAATQIVATSDGAQGVQPWPSADELKASPEDIDLLIAWEDDRGPHTVLVEAKGFTGWGNAQMASKAHRLGAIFAGTRSEEFAVHLLLVGPAPSKGLSVSTWPAWMKPNERAHFLPIKDPGPKVAASGATSTPAQASARQGTAKRLTLTGSSEL